MSKWAYTQVDNQWVSVPHSKNHPRLVTTMYEDMYHWQVGQLSVVVGGPYGNALGR